VRRYLRDPIPQETLEELLSAAISAPSAGNAQPWRFIVVRDQGLKGKLVEAAYGQEFLAEAPVVVVVCADLERARRAYKERGEKLYCLQDTAAAVENLLLAATAKGLGTCWGGRV
jgi:nitroreductase